MPCEMLFEPYFFLLFRISALFLLIRLLLLALMLLLLILLYVVWCTLYKCCSVFRCDLVRFCSLTIECVYVIQRHSKHRDKYFILKTKISSLPLAYWIVSECFITVCFCLLHLLIFFLILLLFISSQCYSHHHRHVVERNASPKSVSWKRSVYSVCIHHLVMHNVFQVFFSVSSSFVCSVDVFIHKNKEGKKKIVIRNKREFN